MVISLCEKDQRVAIRRLERGHREHIPEVGKHRHLGRVQAQDEEYSDKEYLVGV